MALTAKQRHDAFLKRRAEEGQKEMRGIWLTESEEKVIKPDIRDKLKRMRAGTYEPIEE